MDEIRHPRLHQWLSGCRSLMATYPQHGVDVIDSRSPLVELRWADGWNRRGKYFVFVPSGPSDGPALSTLEPPPAGTPIHDVPPGPDLLQSYFWHSVMSRLAEEVETQAAQTGWPADRVTAVMRSIEDGHSRYGAGGLSEGLAELARPYIRRMLVARGGGFGQTSVGDLLSPAIDVVRAYMAFEVPGKAAAELLSMLLLSQANPPEFGPPATTAPPLAEAVVRHLVALSSRLIDSRKTVKVTPYYELGYLANLYALTAIITVRHLADLGGLRGDRFEALQNLAFTIEERRAHALRFDFGVIAAEQAGAFLLETAKRQHRSVREVCRSYAVHPALRQVVLIYADGAPTDPEEMLRAYQNAAAAFEDREVARDVDGGYSPIANAVREELMWA